MNLTKLASKILNGSYMPGVDDKALIDGIAKLESDNELLREALITADAWLNTDSDYDQSPLCNQVYEALSVTTKG